MKIGILGGTFDPVHNGHRVLLELFSQKVGFDKVLIIPTYIPPHKSSDGIADSSHRMNMCRLAFGDVDNVEISSIEIDRGGKSYSYNTLLELKNIYPDSEFFFLMGSDMFYSFDTWYRYKDIFTLCKICACKRYEEDTAENPFPEFADRIIFCENDPLVISSSEIREKIRNGEDVSNLLNPDVLQYIKSRKLYIK